MYCNNASADYYYGPGSSLQHCTPFDLSSHCTPHHTPFYSSQHCSTAYHSPSRLLCTPFYSSQHCSTAYHSPSRLLCTPFYSSQHCGTAYHSPSQHCSTYHSTLHHAVALHSTAGKLCWSSTHIALLMSRAGVAGEPCCAGGQVGTLVTISVEVLTFASKRRLTSRIGSM